MPTDPEDPPRVSFRYFAAARELCGKDDETLAVPSSPVALSALREVLASAHPRLAPYLARMRLAVNGDFAREDTVVHAGDEVIVLPPVAGGAPDGESPLVALRDTTLSVDEVLDAIRHRSAGGIALFLGVVRDHADGAPVERLDYEAYESLALLEMRRILGDIADQRPGVRLAATHRVGALDVGDTAVIVGASAPHRAEAFAACREAIDRLKETVPIWKKEWAPGGEARWVNLEGG